MSLLFGSNNLSFKTLFYNFRTASTNTQYCVVYCRFKSKRIALNRPNTYSYPMDITICFSIMLLVTDLFVKIKMHLPFCKYHLSYHLSYHISNFIPLASYPSIYHCVSWVHILWQNKWDYLQFILSIISYFNK